MARKQYIKWEKFKGINTAIDEREGHDFLLDSENFDSNVIDGQLVSRKGYTNIVDVGTQYLDKIFVYRDEQWGKDVLLAYQKNTTLADRRIRLYTKNLGASGNFIYQNSFGYGSIEFGDKINFLLDRNGVRIGTGTGENNKALYAGYIDRTIASEQAMFGDRISFSGYYLKKQQWIRQADVFSGVTGFRYNSSQKKWYILTNRGLELRDSNFRIERIIEDVISWGGWREGSVFFKDNDLYVLGKQKASGSTTKLYRYDIADDYSVKNSKTYSTTNHLAKSVCTDGSNVFVMIDEAGSYVVRRYPMNISGTGTIIYTATGGDRFNCMTGDQTATTGYLYVADYLNNKLHRFQKDGTTAYGTNVITDATKANLPDDIDFYNARVYWVNDGKVYSIAADFTGSITTQKTDSFTLRSNDHRINIDQATGKAYSYNFDGFIRRFSSATNWTPETTYGALISFRTDQSIDAATYFYGVSVVDIFGQEHMLQSAMAAHAGNAFRQVAIIINPWTELYNEQGLSDVAASHDPANATSTWNELRLILKIRIYRAESSEVNAAWPTTNYSFLKEVDINDLSAWTEHTANKQYSHFFYDSTSSGQGNSVTYSENSGLPERFYPYNTRWQYAKSFKNRFYYGNVSTDNLYKQQFIQTPVNSPDIAYQLSTNIDIFGPEDGDEIKGFSESWQRLVVFKGNKTGLYNELFREKVYDCGLQADQSIIAWNNTVFFLFRDGIYSLTPSGYQRISTPVDKKLAAVAEVNREKIMAVRYLEKQKLWFHVPAGKSFLFNLDKGSWDTYHLNHSSQSIPGNSISISYITTSFDGEIFLVVKPGQIGSPTPQDGISKFNQGYQDDGWDIRLLAKTHFQKPANSFQDSIVYRLFATYQYREHSTGDETPVESIRLLANGNRSYQKTVKRLNNIDTTHYFFSGIFGNQFAIEINVDSDHETIITAIGLELSTNQLTRSKRA